MQTVVSRYGPPHKVEQREGDQTVWTYFDRGSATVGYGGTAHSTFCRAYVLTFDRQEILRGWQQTGVLTLTDVFLLLFRISLSVQPITHGNFDRHARLS